MGQFHFNKCMSLDLRLLYIKLLILSTFYNKVYVICPLTQQRGNLECIFWLNKLYSPDVSKVKI